MHRHIADRVRPGREQRILHRVRDRVARAHRELAVDTHVDVHEVTQPALADATFVERTHARHGEGNRPHFVLEIRRRSRIHHVAQRLTDHRDAVKRDDHARKQRRPIVSRLPPLATPQRDTDPHKRRRRSQCIRVVVQRLDAQRGAADFLTRHNHPAREPHLRDNDARQQHQRPPSRPLVRRNNLVNRVHRDPASHEEHKHRDRQRG